MNILVLNPGSATLKFGLYAVDESATKLEGMSERPTAAATTALASGIVERIGAPDSSFKMSVASRQPVTEPANVSDAANAVEEIIHRLNAFDGGDQTAGMTIHAVGCRVVHGGPTLVNPTAITPSVLDELRTLKDLAPLHIPTDIAVLERLQELLPETPIVAVFDTAFHQTIPNVASTYALPADLCARYGIRRYGFHGISHAYVSKQFLQRTHGTAGDSKIITCHLGSGSSICAVRNGQSVDTSMGLTPMEGLMMGTRSGDIDPGVVLYLMRSADMTVADVDDLLNHQSGLRGVSALSADVRDLEREALNGNAHAELALSMFAYRARKYIGAYAAALEGMQAIVFTGGIGEHAPFMRTRICQGLEFLGVHLDADRNRAATGTAAVPVSTNDSPVAVWVIPTDEEAEIAHYTHSALLYTL